MSDLVGNPEDRFSHAAAQMFVMQFTYSVVGHNSSASHIPRGHTERFSGH